MPIPEDIVTSVAVDNVKTIAGGPATNSQFYQGLAMGNAVHNQNISQQNALAEQNAMGVARLATVKQLIEVDPTESAAVNKLMTGNDVASQMQALLAALNSGAQGVKAQVVTPPPFRPTA
jgi:hypothetical protein